MHYQPRLSTQRAEAVALFGPAGKPSTTDPLISSRPLADVLAEHGYTVISAASAADLSPLID